MNNSTLNSLNYCPKIGVHLAGTPSYAPKLIVTYTTTNKVASYTYDEKGRIKSASYGNGMTETNTYDVNRGWLTDLRYHKNDTTKFRMYNLEYDDVGNLIYSREDDHINYDYDDYYRLERVTYDDKDKQYAYDENGNLNYYQGTSITIDDYSNQIDQSGYAYDDNGNLTTFRDSSLSYDWRNMMVGYGANNTYTYDAFGERIRKYEYGQYRYYVTSGMNILEEYNGDQSLDMSHIYAGSQRIATIVAGDDIFYTCSDQVMSSRALIDEGGDVDQARVHYPYGEIKASSGNKSEYQFSGKENDATGLYYYGARYYDPSIGNWLTCDPAGQFHSPYMYCGNNPMIYVDENGEFAWIPFIAFTLWSAHAQGCMNLGNEGDYWEGFWKGAVVGASGGALGGIANPSVWCGMQSVLVGAGEGVLTNGVNNLLYGKAFFAGAGSAAAFGATFGLIRTEQFRNFVKGDGWISNETLFNQWNSAGRHQDIIDRLGFTDGVYDPHLETAGIDIVNGNFKVSYGYDDFLHGYEHFRSVSFKEYASLERLLANPSRFPIAEGLPKGNILEYESYISLDRNYGLLRSPYRDLYKNRLNNVIVKRHNSLWVPAGYPRLNPYERPWYDFLFRMPRCY